MTVVYTMRDEIIRIISARGAEPYEQRQYHEQETRLRRKTRRTTGAALTRRRTKSATPPRLATPTRSRLRRKNFGRMKQTPSVRMIRRALGLSQEEFAKRFHIPLGTLRDWEQGRKVPDTAARAYLRVIGHNPAAVTEALQLTP